MIPNACIRFLYALIIALIFCAPSVRADEEYGHSEFGTLSTDTTPHIFNVGGIEYRMPANYIQGYAKSPADEVQSLVVMPVVYPGVRPYSDNTKHCFAAQRGDRMPDCYLLEVFIEAPGVATSDEDVLKHMINAPNLLKPGPYGYEMYAGEEARVYRKKIRPDLTIGIQCIGYPPGRDDAAVCDTSVHTKAGGVITLRFDPANLYRADQMVMDVQQFVNDHTLGKK